MWSKALLLAAALSLGTVAPAASLDSTDLPEGTNWYLHVNVELMRSSALGQRMMADSLGEAFEDVEREIGVKFTHQIEGLTVYGGELPPNRGAVVAHGRFSEDVRAELVDVMRSAQVFNEVQFAGTTYYGFNHLDGALDPKDAARHDHDDLDSDHMIYVAFGQDQTLFSQSVETVESFLGAGGYLSGLASTDPTALLVIEADRAMLQGGVNTHVKTGHGKWDSSILSNVDRVTAVLIEENGAASFHADVLAKSPEIAESVRNIVEGLVALKALDSADEPAIGEILRATRIQTSGAAITVDVFLEADLIHRLLDR